jgi:hypothetical protein
VQTDSRRLSTHTPQAGMVAEESRDGKQPPSQQGGGAAAGGGGRALKVVGFKQVRACVRVFIWVCWVWEEREEPPGRVHSRTGGPMRGRLWLPALASQPHNPQLNTQHHNTQEHTLPAGAQSLGELRQEVQRRFGLGEGQPFVLTAMDRTELTEANFRVRFLGFGFRGGGGVFFWVGWWCGGVDSRLHCLTTTNT